MLASTACFTANVLLIRALGTSEQVNVWLVTCTRFVVGLAILLVVSPRELAWRRLFTHGKLAGRGIVGGLGVYAFYLTVVHLGAGRATFINNTYVIFGALLAVWVLGERFRTALAIGGVAALTGLALLTNAFATGASTSIYDLIAVIGAFGAAYVVVTIRQLHATETTATIFAAQCVYGLLICGLPAVLHATDLSWLAWAGMLLAGVFAGGRTNRHDSGVSSPARRRGLTAPDAGAAGSRDRRRGVFRRTLRAARARWRRPDSGRDGFHRHPPVNSASLKSALAPPIPAGASVTY